MDDAAIVLGQAAEELAAEDAVSYIDTIATVAASLEAIGYLLQPFRRHDHAGMEGTSVALHFPGKSFPEPGLERSFTPPPNYQVRQYDIGLLL